MYAQFSDIQRTSHCFNVADHDRVSCLQIRQITADRQSPDWDFRNLFLIKDSLAVMLESASLLEDALREYTELEALFLMTLQQQTGNPAKSTPFGALSDRTYSDPLFLRILVSVLNCHLS